MNYFIFLFLNSSILNLALVAFQAVMYNKQEERKIELGKF